MQTNLVAAKRERPLSSKNCCQVWSFDQSGRSVNLRTASCHGKKARRDAIVRVVLRSISAKNLPKWTSKLSSRVEDHDRSLAELFSFLSKWSLHARWTVPVQWQNALPAISETKWQGECVDHWKPEVAFKLSESARQDVEEESMVIERRWKWPSFYALIVLSWRALGYRTKAKILLVVETQHRSLHTFCNDREWGGRGMDVFTFRTWGWRLLWENNRWRSYTKKSQHQ